MVPGPFCCSSAIPITIKHLSRLILPTATHKPLNPGKELAPLLSTFLVSLCTSHVPIPTAVPTGYVSRYFVIIQVKKTRHFEAPPTFGPSDESSENSSFVKVPMNPRPKPCSTLQLAAEKPQMSSPQSPSGLSDFVEVPLPTPSLRTHVSSSEERERYFVPLESTTKPTILVDNSFVKGKEFREITNQEARASLAPIAGMATGERKKFEQASGVERLWCEDHKFMFELRVWFSEL
ncbi:hypothetical protein LZ554_004634 [Drepanopeziza brunnea f. sp. 'monogermtubi']|nr:hypothetical protein LZ554_004634 [Drepanopeziza brunnea f. sp. 'monogermtubi']